MISGFSFMQRFVLYAADPGASDDQLESLSADCQSATQYPATSTDSDVTVELSSLKGICVTQSSA